MTQAADELRCQIGLSPQCEKPEVMVDCPPYFSNAPSCIPCGKAFQIKFPHCISGLSLRAIAAAEAGE